MKKEIHSILLLAVLFSQPASAQYQTIDRIIVVVNGEIITANELKKEVTLVRTQVGERSGSLPPEEILNRQVLERMIMTRIQLARAEQFGIKVSDEVLNQTINGIAAQNNLTLSQFQQALEKQGFDYAEYREYARDEKTINDLQMREVVSRISITEKDVNDFLANQSLLSNLNSQYLLSHILISIPEAATPDQINQKKSEAEALIKRIRAGEEFAKAAMSASDGQQALQGGSLGWRKMAELPTLFIDQVKELSKGDVSDLMRSPSGFHIVKLMDKRSEEKQHIVKQTKARHILIKTDSIVTDKTAKGRLDVLRERLHNGESFAELAKANSDDPGSASSGGDLGWVTSDVMVPEFQEVMDRLKKGELSKPFKSRYGWHIIQLEDRRDYDNTEEWQKNSAREAIHRRKRGEEIELWMRRIRDEAFVEYRLEK